MSQNTQIKHCSRCKIDKHVSDFNRDRARRDGLMLYCRECMKEVNRVIRKRNNAQRTEYNKRYRDANRSSYNQWERDNYCRNTQTLNKNAKSWRERQHGTVRMMFLAARNRAKKKQIDFDLTVELIQAFIVVGGNRCALTGIAFDYESDDRHHFRPFAPSIDRRDNSRGYTPDNIQIVCVIVNKARNEYPVEMFDLMCRARVERLNRG